MSRFALRTRTTVTTNAAACYELIAGADRLALMELHVFLGAATQSLYGLGRPAAIGITPTSPVTLLQEDPADTAPGAKAAVAWGTGPTVPANFLRCVNLPAAIGAGIIWTFGPKGLIVAANASLVLWNLQANSAVLDVVAICEE
jgi:hypothetical protein